VKAAASIRRRCDRGLTRAASILALALAGVAICAPAVARNGARACPEAQLGQLRRSFESAMWSKRREQVLELYSPDAVFLDEVSRRLSGRAQLDSLYRTVFAKYDSHLRLTPVALAPRSSGKGFVCVERGRFSEDLRDHASGTVQRAQGPYRFAYARSPRGRWRFVLMDWRPTAQP